MKLIILLLILFSISSQGHCNQIPVLKYKDGNECESALVGIPINSASSTLSLLDEFTFCSKYYFRFLRRIFLMSIEPNLFLEIFDFENKKGYVFHQGAYYQYYFQHQTVTQDSWHYICLAISSAEVKIVWNGEILLSDPKLDLSTTEIRKTKLWLGGTSFSEDQAGRFGGMIANAHFWNDALQDYDLISITTNNKTVIKSAKYDLLSSTIPKNSSCVEYLIVDENDVLFQNVKARSQPETLLIEYKTDFYSSNYICQGYGGNLTVPKNKEDMETLGFFIQQSDVCESAFLGLKKSSDEKILDLKNNPVLNMKWYANQPNGGETQKCINTWGSYLNDLECDWKTCFSCQILEKSMFVLRGPIPADTERKYFVKMNKKHKEIRGITKTNCLWNRGKWNFGINLQLDNATNNMPPTGFRIWNKGLKLKFTQCKQNEFTCHAYGHCISMDKRCDGHPDCPGDGSDENECKIMILNKGYDEKYPSEKNLTAFVSLKVYDIVDVDELHMSYTVHFKIQLKWFDSRIIFRNLKPTDYDNMLDIAEIEKIWTPKLYVEYSHQVYVEAGQKTQDGKGYVMIHRNGYPKVNELSEMDEDYLYPGNENPIIMFNYLTLKLGCKFDLVWYPFDTQKCPIKLLREGKFYLKWNDPPIIKKVILTQYDALQYLEYDNDTLSKIASEVEITLCRKLSYHIVNIYLPTLCLILIAGFTLFIDFSHFEVNIMIALTSMLVTYTLYQSISEYLPNTSYMKMIDIWLFGGLIFPFFIITILVIMDYLVVKEKNQVIDMTKEGEMSKSTMFMISMKFTILTIGTTLCIIYWVVGLHHYYSTCPI